MSIHKEIISAIRSATCSVDRLDLHAPTFGDLEKRYVSDCIDSTWVSSTGYYLTQFEKKLAEFCGVKNVICCVNATAGLHVSLLGIGVKAEDEVLLPAFSFVATANAVCYVGATPHFIDISPDNFGVNSKLLENYLENIIVFKNNEPFNKISNKKIAALMVVHCFGYPVDIDPLLKICKRFNIQLIEDAAAGLGSYYKNTHVGNFGRAAVLSFNGNKIITTGGGGAILTNDDELALYIRHLATTAKNSHPWAYHHDAVGYNYRMPNLNAALGLAQLEKLPIYLKNKRALHENYKQAFKDMSDVKILTDNAMTQSNHWLNTLILSPSAALNLEKILEEAHKENILLRPVWKMLPKQIHLKRYPKMNLINADNFENRILNLPSSEFLANA